VLVNSLAHPNYEIVPPLVENISSDIYQSFGSFLLCKLAFQNLRVREMVRISHICYSILASVVVGPVLILLREECVMCALYVTTPVGHQALTIAFLEVPAATSRLQRSNLLANFQQVRIFANSKQW
jgi:hypothetical protein